MNIFKKLFASPSSQPIIVSEEAELQKVIKDMENVANQIKLSLVPHFKALFRTNIDRCVLEVGYQTTAQLGERVLDLKVAVDAFIENTDQLVESRLGASKLWQHLEPNQQRYIPCYCLGRYNDDSDTLHRSVLEGPINGIYYAGRHLLGEYGYSLSQCRYSEYAEQPWNRSDSVPDLTTNFRSLLDEYTRLSGRHHSIQAAINAARNAEKSRMAKAEAARLWDQD